MCYIFVAQAVLQLVEHILAVPDVHGCWHGADHLQLFIERKLRTHKMQSF
jgi:hypothetical protein